MLTRIFMIFMQFYNFSICGFFKICCTHIEIQNSNQALLGPVILGKSQKVSLKCLNCLVLIISSNGGFYDLYACIGYQSDSNRSLVKLIAGNGINKIDYSAEDTEESRYGYYTITNGNTVNDAYIYRLRLTSLK